ncbi:MAG: hypothetical protein AB1778_00330 [Candidatus Bipolaricaulota bacterium]
MKTKTLRVLLLIVVLSAAAVIPASTQVLPGRGATEEADGASLEALVLINRLELSRGQMESIHAALDRVLVEREAIEAKRAAFEDEMISWSGTAEELEARLDARRQEMEAAQEALRGALAGAFEEIKGTLTMSQGETLLQYGPAWIQRALEAPTPTASVQEPQALVQRLRERVAERAEGASDGANVIERLREQLAARIHDRDASTDAPTAGRAGAMQREMSNPWAMRHGPQSAQPRPEDVSRLAKAVRAGVMDRLLGGIESFSHALELKLAAVP